MKISASDGYRDAYKTVNGILLTNHLITLCCLLVLINFSIIWISLRECHHFYFLVPVCLLLFTFKLVWDQNSRFYSLVAVFLTTTVFLILYANLVETRYQQQLRLFYNIIQISDKVVEQPAVLADIKALDSDQSKKDEIGNHDPFNIFFIETNKKKEVLTYREMCAIESAAKNNPNARVLVYTMNAKAELYFNKTNISESKQQELLRAYKNIEMRKLDPIDLFKSTPLLKWWEKREWALSPYILAHVSDAARLALLWKNGGFYSDLDTITIKDLKPVTHFSSVGHMVERKGQSLGNGVMSFEKSHPLLEEIMVAFEKNYRPFAWSETGPMLVMKEMKTYCQTDNIHKSQLIDQATFERLVAEQIKSTTPKWESFKYSNNETSSHKCDVLIYPKWFYYPFDYRFDLDQIFKPNVRLAISKLINTYSVHFYGKLSSHYRVHIGDNSLYEYLAINHCPIVYASVKSQNAYFN